MDGLFNRFRPYRLKDKSETEWIRPNEVNIFDLLIALNFQARYNIEKKLTLLFEVCDLDEDGCMYPVEIL